MSFISQFLSTAAASIGLSVLTAHGDGTHTTPAVTMSHQQALGYYHAMRSYFKISPIENAEESGPRFKITKHDTKVRGKLATKREMTMGDLKKLFKNAGNDSLSRAFKRAYPTFETDEQTTVIGTAATLAEAKQTCIEKYNTFRNADSTRFFNPKTL